ncbi:MAG: glycosyltransferase [bacterium]
MITKIVGFFLLKFKFREGKNSKILPSSGKTGDVAYHFAGYRGSFFKVLWKKLSIQGSAFNAVTGLPCRIIILCGKKRMICESLIPDRADFEISTTFRRGFKLLDFYLEENQAGMKHYIGSRLIFSLRNTSASSSSHLKTISYSQWVKNQEALSHRELPEKQLHCDLMISKPVFAVMVTDSSRADLFEKTRTSLDSQLYPHWKIINIALIEKIKWEEIVADYVLFIKAGDVLNMDFLYELAAEVNRDNAMDLIYTDEDIISKKGKRFNPFFKPEWSPDYFESFNYIGYAACFRMSVAAQCGECCNFYDFVLRFTEKTSRIAHLEKVLYHRFGVSGVPVAEAEDNIKALRNRLNRTGRQGEVIAHDGGGYFEISPLLKNKPLVSIIIPTAGKSIRLRFKEVNLIQNCIASIKNRSTYSNYECIVVDNDDLSEHLRKNLENQGCRFVHYREPKFNVAKKLNLGAVHAQGEYLLLLNDDIEIMTPDWIERMLGHFEKDHVGVVGCKLLFPNLKIQHAGVVHNFGCPTHVQRFSPRSDKGYFYSTCAVRNYSAVTGAVMMTPAKLYRELGGYTEALPVNFNDTDYCMKAQTKNKTVVYDPYVEIIHFESTSRSKASDLDETDYYQTTWARETARDPYYNEKYFTVTPPQFESSIRRIRLESS